MCLHHQVGTASTPTYDGGVIIHDCVVPSARAIAGSGRRGYDIDVREFLTRERNAVIRRVLRRDLRDMLERKGGGDGGPQLFGSYRDTWDFCQSGDPGSFDYRVRAVQQFVASRIRYRRDRKRDTWQFPDETLRLGRGDCEDIAFLLASLLQGIGISPYNIRVCLGTLHMKGTRVERSYDHMWVAYRNERGSWGVIEPLAPAASSGKRSAKWSPARVPALSYRPAYGFNGDHLWEYAGADGGGFKDVAGTRTSWTRFTPSFAGIVHKSIISEALAGYAGSHPVLLNLLNAEFIEFLGDPEKTVAEIDLPWKYHPYDHFDNGYIAESWARVDERLARCADAGNRDMVRDFSRAAHAIADFYAHTSYAHFAQRDAAGALLLGRDEHGVETAPERRPSYDDASDFPINRFRPATPWQGNDAQRVSIWNGALLSGRWRLPGDFGTPPEASTWTEEVHDRRMRYRMSLPHHDDIAVDHAATHGSGNNLYPDAEYARQYDLRYDAAVRHVRRAFEQHGAELLKLG